MLRRNQLAQIPLRHVGSGKSRAAAAGVRLFKQQLCGQSMSNVNIRCVETGLPCCPSAGGDQGGIGLFRALSLFQSFVIALAESVHSREGIWRSILRRMQSGTSKAGISLASLCEGVGQSINFSPRSLFGHRDQHIGVVRAIKPREQGADVESRPRGFL